MTANGEPEAGVTEETPRWTPEQVEAMCPADPDIMYSRSGDIRGLRKLQDAARARRDELDRKYPGLRVS